MKVDITGLKTEKVNISVDTSSIISALWRTWKAGSVPEDAYISEGLWQRTDQRTRFIYTVKHISDEEREIINAFDIIRDAMKKLEIEE